MMTVHNSDVDTPARPGDGLERPDLGTRLQALLRGASLGRFSGFALWGLFILIFALWVPQTFLTASTVKSILLSAQAFTPPCPRSARQSSSPPHKTVPSSQWSVFSPQLYPIADGKVERLKVCRFEG